jgi:hypothetical protein
MSSSWTSRQPKVKRRKVKALAREVMRLNHIICPNCGHDFFDSDHVQIVCDACGQKFHLSESKTSRRPETVAEQQEQFHRNLAKRNK